MSLMNVADAAGPAGENLPFTLLQGCVKLGWACQSSVFVFHWAERAVEALNGAGKLGVSCCGDLHQRLKFMCWAGGSAGGAGGS